MEAKPENPRPGTVGSLQSRPIRNLGGACPPVTECGILLIILLFARLVLASQGESNFAAAEKLYAAGKLAEAEAVYQTIGNADQDFSRALRRLGAIYYLTERPALAEEKFALYAKLQDSAEAYTLLAGVQFDMRKFDTANESAERAIHLDPSYYKAFTALGMIHAALGDWPGAEKAYDEALRLNGRDADSWFLLGRGYFLRNDFGKAKDAFQKSLNLSPQQVRNYTNLALAAEAMGEDEAVENVLQQGVKVGESLAQPDVAAAVDYGIFLLEHGRDAESMAVLRQAIKASPRNGKIHYELARCLFRRKQFEEAAAEAEDALRISGPGYKVHYLLSRIYTALGDTQNAARHAEEASHLADQRLSFIKE
jgi:tetratricopeptide (TPR) repeat protein